MYQFDEKNAITKVMKMQKRRFSKWVKSLEEEAVDFKKISYKDGERHYLASVVVEGSLRAAKLEGKNIWTGDKDVVKIFYLRGNGELCRYVDDAALFPANKDMQQRVFTLLSKDGKSVREFRVTGDNVKAEEKAEFDRLCYELEVCREAIDESDLYRF